MNESTYPATGAPPPFAPSERRFLLGVFGLGLLLCLPMILCERVPTQDTASRYIPMIRELAAGNWRNAFCPRIQPLFPCIGAVLACLGIPSFTAAKTASTLLFALGVFPVYAIHRDTFGRTIGRWATVLYMLSPRLVRYGGSGLRDSGKTLFLLAAGYGLITFRRKPSWEAAAWAGGGCVGMILIRGDGLVVAAVSLVVLLLLDLLAAPGRRFRFPARAIGTVAAVGLLISPWVLYEYRVTGVPVTDSRQIPLIRKAFAAVGIQLPDNPGRLLQHPHWPTSAPYGLENGRPPPWQGDTGREMLVDAVSPPRLLPFALVPPQQRDARYGLESDGLRGRSPTKALALPCDDAWEPLLRLWHERRPGCPSVSANVCSVPARETAHSSSGLRLQLAGANGLSLVLWTFLIEEIVVAFAPWYLFPAFLVMFARYRRRLWTVDESFLVALILGHTGLLAAQVFLFSGFAGDHVSKRYVVAALPFLFGWSAVALRGLYVGVANSHARHAPKVARGLAAFLVLLMIWDGTRRARPLADPKKRNEYLARVDCGRWLREEGHAFVGEDQERLKPTWHSYHSGRLPVILGDAIIGCFSEADIISIAWLPPGASGSYIAEFCRLNGVNFLIWERRVVDQFPCLGDLDNLPRGFVVCHNRWQGIKRARVILGFVPNLPNYPHGTK